MNIPSTRTQIILNSDLRNEIEKARRITGESLAEYLRASAYDRLKKEKKKKIDLKKLADEFVGAAKGTRTKAEIQDWIKEIKEDRQKSDRQMSKHW
jgi:CRISPR/Cas system-associated protein Cas7 (RAMP superfamily)